MLSRSNLSMQLERSIYVLPTIYRSCFTAHSMYRYPDIISLKNSGNSNTDLQRMTPNLDQPHMTKSRMMVTKHRKNEKEMEEGNGYII
jgi:hypothetical protein